MYVFVLVVAHNFTCIWYYVSDGDNPESWISRYHYDSEILMDRYVAALYFVYTTLTTTGYGDIAPKLTEEFGMTIAFVAIGVTMHSYIYT